MKKSWLIAGAVATATVIIQPATARWTVTSEGQPVAVARSGLTVTASGRWNMWSRRPIRQSEVWTIDGFNLNELAFFGGVPAGQPIFREVDRRNRPLPRFTANMLPTDIVQLYESSSRIALNTASFTVDQVEPVNWLGQSGVKFQYTYVVESDGLKRRGEARAAVVDGKLYMISFVAPDIHYFGRDIATARGIMDSARLGEVARRSR